MQASKFSSTLPPSWMRRCVFFAIMVDKLEQPLKGFDMRAHRAVCLGAGLAMKVLLTRARIRQ